MKANRKLIQIFLISIGFLIIIGTYLLYPKIEQNRLKDSVVENEPIPKNVEDDDLGSKFEELEFRGFYNFDNPFRINDIQLMFAVSQVDSNTLVTLLNVLAYHTLELSHLLL